MIVNAQSPFHPTSQILKTLQPTIFSCSSVSLNWGSISQPCSRRCSGLFSKDHDSGEMQWLRKLSRGCFMAKAEKGEKVEVESVHGGEDIFDAASAEAKVQPQHLVIMVNGLVGSAADWRYAAERFVKRLPDKIIVHRSDVNTARLTFDGVDRMGERLAEEVIKVVQRWPGLKRISFVAHSLGGLVARYAIGILYGISCQTEYASQSEYSSIGEENNYGQHVERIYVAKIAGLEPFNLITFATPHLGSIGREQLPLLCGLPTLERSASQTAHWIAVCIRNLCGFDEYQNNQDFSNGDKGSALFNVLDTKLKESLDRLSLMRESTAGVNSGDRTSISCRDTFDIRRLCLKGEVAAALSLCSRMLQKGIVPDAIDCNYLINGLCKIGDLQNARWLLEEMRCRGSSLICVTYNTLINAYCRLNDMDGALNLLSTMESEGIAPNVVTHNIIIHALCKKRGLEEAKQFLGKLLVDNQLENFPNLITSTTLMDHSFKNGDTAQALSYWQEMSQRSTSLDVVAYNVVVHGFSLIGDIAAAYKYVGEMFKSGFPPVIFSYNTLISVLCKGGRTGEACYVYGVMMRMGVVPDEITYKIIIQGLCINGEVIKAYELLLVMLENRMVPKPLIWNVIIDGYGRHSDIQKALSIKDQMAAFGVQPNVFTYNALILAETKMGNLSGAFSWKKEMILDGSFPDLVTYNILLNAACNFSDIQSALGLYIEMQKAGHIPDIITYTELIKCFCIQGRLKEAEDILLQVQKLDLQVDHVPILIIMKRYWKMKRLDKAIELYQQWSLRE